MTVDAGTLVALTQSAAEDKKAVDVVILEIGRVSLIADYFLIASGTSKTQVQAIADHIIEKAKEMGYTLLHKEGYTEGRWVLLDFGYVITHIFQPEERDFYNLERLWSHAPKVASISRL